MLVEGMLARLPLEPASGDGSRWAVAIDSELSGMNKDGVLAETSERPLPVRVRNTVAHELAHSLAFRSTEFGLRLSLNRTDGTTEQAFVREIEKETEKLSPLLLIPASALRRLVQGREEPVSAANLANFARTMGVSREVLISRLATLPGADGEDFRERKGLYRLGVGIGFWDSDGQAHLGAWPLFQNFERAMPPTFMARLASNRQKDVAISDLVNDPDFALLGGNSLYTEFETTVAADPMRGGARIQVRLSVEPGARRPGSRFIFAATGTLVKAE